MLPGTCGNKLRLKYKTRSMSMEAIFRAYCDSWAVREAGINLFLEPRCDDSSQTTTTTQWDLALKKKSTMLTTHNTQTFFLFLSLSFLKRMCLCPKIFKHKNKDIVSLNSYRSQTGVQFFRDIFIVSGEEKNFFSTNSSESKKSKSFYFRIFHFIVFEYSISASF